MTKKTFFMLTLAFFSYATSAQKMNPVYLEKNLMEADVTSKSLLTSINCEPISSFPFEEGFEDNGKNLPECWESLPLVGTGNWTIEKGHIGTPAPPHSGTYKIRYFNKTKGSSARLTMPVLDLSSLSEPVLNFWHTQGDWDGDQDTLKIYYKTSEAGEWNHLITYNESITVWTKAQIELPEPSSLYYISFVGCSQYGRGVQLDDIEVAGSDYQTDGHDLKNTTTYSYSQVPASQLLPAATVKNVGFATQTNIILTAEINGTEVGTSEPLEYLEVGETAPLKLSTEINIPLGMNTLTYTITQDQIDDTPEDNVVGFAFTGTQNIFAIDEVTTCINGAGSGVPTTFGLIYNINSPVTVSQVIDGHGLGTTLEYSVSLYTMEDELTTAAEPLFTQKAVRNANGFHFITVPKTQLVAGNYFLCVNQVSNTNVSIAYDENLANVTYLRTANGTISETPVKVGALAIRMAFEAPDCVAQQPENLTVVPDYMSAFFSWEGTTPSYFLVTISDGTQDFIFKTTHHELTLDGMIMGSEYTWKVAAMCDAVNGIETEGDPFFTLNCEVIDTFPYEENFENEDREFGLCWFQEHIVGNSDWTIEEASTGMPATAHGGNYKALFLSNKSNAITKLILPPFDLTELNNPRLSFWHTQAKQALVQDTLMVYYKTSLYGDWETLATYSDNISNWTQQIIELPEPSSNYFIAFEGRRPDYVYGFGIQLDDIKVIDFYNFIDGEITHISSPMSGVNYELTQNEPVTVVIKNNGSNSLSNFDLILELDGVEIATELFTATIEKKEQTEYTFAETLNLLKEQTYEITVKVVIDGDEVLENNMKTITVENVICKSVSEFPFKEGFEGETFPPVCWSVHNLGESSKNWERSTAHKNSGEASACHQFSSDITEGWLVTPAIEINQNGEFSIEFWSYNQFMSDNYYNGVWISTSGNNPKESEFTELKQLTGSEISYYWQKIIIPLDKEYVGKTIHLGFKYAGRNADSWHIDDVEINFIPIINPETFTVTLSVNPAEAGTVSGAGVFEEGKNISIEATPNDKYEFVNWTKEEVVISTELSFSFTVTEDVVLTANFKETLNIPDINSAGRFTIFPNPVKDLLRIVKENTDNVRIEIYNMYGSIIQTLEIQSKETVINVSHLPMGVYFVRLVNNQTVSALQFIKN
jgi:hypothetical protein